MGKQNLFDKVREFIGGVAFNVLLWSLRMTAEQYYDETERNARNAFYRFVEYTTKAGWIVDDALKAIGDGSYIEIANKQ